MPVQAIFAIVFIIGSIVYMFWMKGKAKQSLADARPAFHNFFQQTGYRYADIESEPVEAQVDRAYHDAAHPDPTGNVNLHYVRNFHGVRVHYRRDLRGLWFDGGARVAVADLVVWGRR